MRYAKTFSIPLQDPASIPARDWFNPDVRFDIEHVEVRIETNNRKNVPELAYEQTKELFEQVASKHMEQFAKMWRNYLTHGDPVGDDRIEYVYGDFRRGILQLAENHTPAAVKHLERATYSQLRELNNWDWSTLLSSPHAELRMSAIRARGRA